MLQNPVLVLIVVSCVVTVAGIEDILCFRIQLSCSLMFPATHYLPLVALLPLLLLLLGGNN